MGRRRPDRREHRPRRGRQVSRALGSFRARSAPAGFRGRPDLARAGKRGAGPHPVRRCSIVWRPGRGQGLAATYFDNPGFAGPAVERLDPVIDVGTAWPATTRLPAGIAPSDFSAIWQGEIVPDYSDSLPVRRDHRRACRAVDRRPGAAATRAARAAAGAGLPARHLRARRQAHRQHVVPGGLPPVRRSDLRAGSLLLQRRLSLVLLDGARLGRQVRDRGERHLRPDVHEPAAQPHDAPARRARPCCSRPACATRSVWRSTTAPPTSPRSSRGSSARQAREVVPARALFAPAAAAENAGAGLNVVVFARGPAGSAAPPDLDEPLGAGPTPDLTLRPPAGATGLPLVDVIASGDDAAAGVPPPPAVVSPRRGARVFQPAPQVLLTVLGGVQGRRAARPGSAAAGGPGADVVLPFDADGNLVGGVVPVRKLRRAHAAAVAADGFGRGERARELGRRRRRAGARRAAAAGDVGTARSDLTARIPRQNVFAVSGRGLPAPVQICDRGGAGQSGVIAHSLQAAADGTISGSVTLTARHARRSQSRAGTSCRCRRTGAPPPASPPSSASASGLPPSSFRARARPSIAAP